MWFSYDMGFVKLTDGSNKHHSPGTQRNDTFSSSPSRKSKLIPMQITNANIPVANNRKIVYRKIHKYAKKDYLIEIGKTKTKYLIVAIELSKKQTTQALEVTHIALPIDPLEPNEEDAEELRGSR